jgi:16S rRNA (adenine1518-N6/adenine1519-N6)-dimethyltransferase
LVFKLLDYGPLIADMHFMLQLEVVERLAAEPGNKSWGRLGVMAQFQCEVEQLFEVPPEAFFPPPKVQSAIIRLTPRQTPRWAQVDREALSKVVSQAFSQRRKTLRNNFKNSLTDTQFEAAGVDPQARAETLTIDHFVALASLSRS